MGVTRRTSAVSIQQKRAQVSSISDEILGEEDLTNVDEAFESLLNSTFQEAQARGRTRSEHSRGGSKRRSQSSHPSSNSARNSEVGSASSLSSAAPGLQQKSSRKSSSNSLTSSSSVNRKQSRNKVNISDQQPSSSQVMPNKEVLADPLGALPTSHTKKYLPRQQTWASGTPPPPLPQTPSPTQSGVNSQQSNTKSVDQSTPRLTRQASLPSLNKEKTTNLSASNQSNPVRRSTVVARSPSSAKEVILSWVQERTNTYPNLKVTNFSSSWNNGLAFCALIHYYYPEAFEYDKLDPKNRKYNFDLAFKSAEKYADICPLLDVEDMVMFEKPDWKCVFTYVQSFYRRFRNGRDPPVPTKKLTLTPPPKAIPASKSIEVSKNPKKSEDEEPYYFPAPEITEEKKSSLMQKYLF